MIPSAPLHALINFDALRWTHCTETLVTQAVSEVKTAATGAGDAAPPASDPANFFGPCWVYMPKHEE